MSEPHIEYLQGEEIGQRFEQIAALRLQVFREWPYLYDGSMEEERYFLRFYLDAPWALATVVVDGDEVVGLSTAMPLTDESPRIQKPFIDEGFDPGQVFYLAESILLPAYRGRGFYRHFFDVRERHARSCGDYQWATLCTVVRDPAHPLRPADYQPLDPVWRHFGYTPREELIAYYPWKQVDEPAETDKPLQFWIKQL
ncbi:MAG: GNAT family N-acetyltransferase [Halorhodospira halophila]|uniref:GNAT family N-acetyltransferase n=1 Tax=Halorhodospira TaxID=85108 RepID=UPI0019113104|nr:MULTISPECIES: GNAT family N-acetyltransferase [Halorhodospira]MBK5937289.1 hypothetical protein [Halorhodospira halophila]MBK5944194.1 hypothetical protein [Halorhodospira halophila]MCC3749771.1 GNAT family N-acetyltransferase [Halorhodospira halophila]MCG5527687.1 GNAT family N-acetyltransferase [Halorhodospira halophila]MCG5534038.1 GNAT family N-acetyltransferase [Halorhodospira sp. 9621]